jgi:Fe2+ or Zn2+ uptake regulation protein
MLDRQHGKIVFECDSCNEVLETETSDFDDALSILKREEWKAEKIGGVWIHACPECKVDR